MNLKPAHFSDLYSVETRNTAKLAAMARADTVHGGASALVLAERIDKGSKLPFEHSVFRHGFADNASASEIVNHVYSHSTGRPCERFEGWECSECGNAHLGKDSAFACCAPCEDSENELAEVESDE